MNARQIAPALAVLVLSLGVPASAAETPPPDKAAASAAAKSEQGSAAAMAREHAHDAPTPSPAAAPEPRRPVTGEEVVYATVDGRQVTGYLARPKGATGKLPGLIVIHEWWGLNDNIRAMTRRLAGEGYAALAVDLYGGATASTPEAARQAMEAAMASPAKAEENLRQAYGYLDQTLGAPKIGVIGWCFGGGWSLRAAQLLPDALDAAVIYYGRVETDPAKLKDLSMPILGVFGEEDEGIPVAAVREFERILREQGKSAEIHVYPGADHAFANPSGGNYHPQAAADAWEKTIEFLARNLK